MDFPVSTFWLSLLTLHGFLTGLLPIDSFESGADAYQGPSGFAAMHSLMLLSLLGST